METNLDTPMVHVRRGPRWRAIVLRSILTITVTIVAHAAPASLVANEGQWSSNVAFAGSLAGLDVRVERDGLVFVAVDREAKRAAAIRLDLGLSSTCGVPVGGQPLPGTYNFFLGNEPERWRTGLTGFGKVKFSSAWEGVDLVVCEQDGEVALSFDVAAGVEPELINWRIVTGSETRLEEPSVVVAETAFGDCRLRLRVEQSLPNGSVRTLACAYELDANGRMSVHAAGRDESLPLTINLGLDWSTFLGGSSTDYIREIATTATGDIVVAGETGSDDFPVTPGAFDPTGSAFFDVFLTRLDPTGSQLLMSTYLGGNNQDLAGHVAVAGDGSVIVAGYTASSDFPTTPGAYDQTMGGLDDFFAARVSEDGGTLVWSTFVGGDSIFGEYGDFYDMAVAPDESVYITGRTWDATYPVTPGAYDTTPGSANQDDIVVSHISADGSALLHSTFFGGSDQTDLARAICVMDDGVVITGSANALTFPITPGAYGAPPGVFVSKFDFALSKLLFSSIVHGSNSDTVHDVAADPSGNVTVVGQTLSTDWPTTPGAFDKTYGGGTAEDAFITKLNATGSALVYSTYLGGDGQDGAWAVDVDNAGVATVGGYTTAPSALGFPVTPGAWDVTGNGDLDAFVVRLSPDGSQDWYGTFLGGSDLDCDDSQAGRLNLLEFSDGSVLVGGSTRSTDFPVTAGAYGTTFSGGVRDAFLAKLSMLPLGASRYGSSTEGCAGYLAMGVTAMPKVGKSFALTCRNAPPSSPGLLALGLSDLGQPLIAKGAALWVDPNPLLLLLPLQSNEVGFATLGGLLPNDPGLAGATFTVQCFWPDACAADGPYAASNALAITIQP